MTWKMAHPEIDTDGLDLAVDLTNFKPLHLFILDGTGKVVFDVAVTGDEPSDANATIEWDANGVVTIRPHNKEDA